MVAAMTKPITYGTYLRVPELLALQSPVSEPAEHDELLFIVIHQVHELWFKQLLHEVDAIQRALGAGRPLVAIKAFKRVHAIQRVLIEQIDVLETMTPVEFNTFRSLLRPASGFQSTQFREIELSSGGGNRQVLSHMQQDPGLARVEARLAQPTLYEALLSLLAARGHDVPPELIAAPGASRPPREDAPRLIETFRKLYESATRSPADYELYLLCEAYIDYDELFLLWRHRHVRMVERTIGMKGGTGGSDGVPYLQRTLSARFFPELWSVRTVLGPPSGP